jgi:hypothetical protein
MSTKAHADMHAQLKSSFKHVRNIIGRCKKLPLHDAWIQSFIRTIGLGALFDPSKHTWELAGPLYTAFLKAQQPIDNHYSHLIESCKTLWSYTCHGMPLHPACNHFTSKYRRYFAVYDTIESELQQFIQTYPLPHNIRDEPHVLVFVIPKNRELLSQLQQFVNE